MKNVNRKSTKVLVVMRHGERIDATINEKLQKCPEIDPELTGEGLEQAKNVGKQILNRLDIKDFKEINIFTSPFVRCIMTGLNVLKALNKDQLINNINLYTSNSLFEYCTTNNFKTEPFNQLVMANISKNKKCYEEFIEKFLPEKCKFKVKFPEINVTYPENFNLMVKRFRKTAETLCNEIINKSNDYSINIVVTHGYGVQVISEKISNDAQIKADFDYVDYCTTFCFNIINNSEIKFAGEINPTNEIK